MKPPSGRNKWETACPSWAIVFSYVVAENGVAARYFHYNDLGTVLAQTESDGTLEGAWEPDHFGNYEGRYA
jgi:hypothetical protein